MKKSYSLSPRAFLCLLFLPLFLSSSRAAVPTVTTVTATSVAGTTATLNATVNPNSLTTVAYFQYDVNTNANPGIPNPSFEANTYTVFPGYANGNGGVITGWTISDANRIGLNPAGSNPFADNGATPSGANVAFIQSNGSTNTLSTTITNLVAGKSYTVTFRYNCRGTPAGTPGASWSLNGGSFIAFTASPAVGAANPYYTNSGTFVAASNSAALVLQNYSAADTTVLLDNFSVSTLPYRNISTTTNLTANNTAQSVSNLISGLQPLTTYHFQVVASNSSGTASGADVTFTTGSIVPTAVSSAASGIGATNATLNGSVNPNGVATAAYFQYGLTTSYGLSGPTNNLTAGNTPVAFSNLLSSLIPGTLYHFRLVATNSAGGVTNSDQTFTTSPTAPIAISLAASSISATNATLNGTVNPGNGATAVYFQYGLTTNYVIVDGAIFNPGFEANTYSSSPGYASGNGGVINGWAISDVNRIGLNSSGNNAFADNGAIPAGTNVAFIQSNGSTNTLSTTLSNLVAGKTYMVAFRANCRASLGNIPGASWSLNGGNFVPFTSGPAVGGTNPYYTNSGTFTATASTAALVLQNYSSVDTTVLLDDFSVSTPYGNLTTTSNLAATNTAQSVSNLISGLQPGATYHFQIVAVNSVGSALGNDLSFTTSVAAPTAVSLPASDINATNATLNGTINPNGLATAAYFQYGLTTSYGSFSPTNNLTATNTSQAISNLITSFPPGTLYHFRLVAINSAGGVTNSDQTFTTSIATPAVITLAATGIGRTNATLNGTVNPGNGATTAYFRYGLNTNYFIPTGTILNPGFETDNYTASPGYANGNGSLITGWTISDASRIGLNPVAGNAFANNGAIPVGSRVAFIQSNGSTNTLSTTVSNLVAGKTYTVTFRANCRSGYGPFTAAWSLNGGSFVPFTASPAVGGANPYYTNSGVFTATSNTAALVLQNYSTGDTAVLLDDFSIGYYGLGAPINLPATNIAQSISNNITDLQPATTYHFQAVATNSSGSGTGADLSFTTVGTSPTATTLPASGITSSNALFNGTSNPNGLNTSAYFQYGLDTNYGFFSSTNILTSTNATLAVSITNSILPGTTYHFRLVTTNSAGGTVGADVTFSSPAAIPTITTLAASGITSSAITLNGTVNPGNGATTAYFRYGLTASYGSFSATNTLAATNVALAISNLISGLNPGTLYHFQIVATNSSGIATGTDLTFMTGPATPTAITFAASAITTTNAMLNGQANPNGSETFAYFQYGLTTAYGSVSATNTLAATNVTLSLSNLVNLSSLTTYHFRLVTTNAAGGTTGADMTFTTLPELAQVTTLPATSIGVSNAILNASVIPGNGGAAAYFRCGTTTNYFLSGSISNPSFEADNYTSFPGYASGNGGTISGWTLSDASRIGLNPSGSSPFADNGAIPAGANVAFIQSNGSTNTLSTIINNLMTGLTYRVTFRANCRLGSSLFNPAWSLNGGSFVPFTAGPAVGGTNAYYTNSGTFTATASTAALVLQNYSSVDTTVLLDDFSVAILAVVTNLAPTNSAQLLAYNISGLQPATTYHFQVIATNLTGTASGADLTFQTGTTTPAAVPLPPTSVTSTNAILQGAINPNGLVTSYYFQYGQDTSYGFATATNILPATNIIFTVSNLISNAFPGSINHFRIVAGNSAGTVSSADLAFTTRRLPAALSITNSGDTGPGTLRQSLLDSYDDDSLIFATNLSGASIQLTNGVLLATKNLTIDASALPAGLTINGLGATRIFQVNSNITLVLTALTLTNGSASVSGGGVFNSGDLTLNGCTLTGNSTTGLTGGNGSNGGVLSPASGGVGGKATGGAIYNEGTLRLNQCTFAGNQTKGGTGGTGGSGSSSFKDGAQGGPGGISQGAAIYNTGIMAVNQCTVASNTATGGSGGSGGARYFDGFISGHAGADGPAGSGIGGGICQSNTLTLFNSIVAGNSPDNIAGGGAPLGNNLTNGNPLLSALSNNGGPTPTMLPLTNSPAFDAGAVTTFTNDQRGLPRVLGNAPDLGAVEINAPTVVTLPASDINGISATLNGLVNPYGFVTSNYFQYGATTNYDHYTATNLLASTNIYLSLAGLITNLSPGATYHFQLVASSSLGQIKGADLTFTNLLIPIATTLPASDISSNSATLNATVNPDTLATIAYFRYGLTTNYGLISPLVSLAATNVSLIVSNSVTGLSFNTVYHFQVVASNDVGTVTGTDMTLTSSPIAPTVSSLASTLLTTNVINGIRTVQLSAAVDPNGSTFTAYFEYGSTAAYGATSTSFSSSVLSNLSTSAVFSAGSTYHWRIVASNAIGTTISPDQTFNLGSISGPLAGDLNGDGVVSQAELDAIYGNYFTNSPYLYMTNLAGLGGSNVTFSLSNSLSGSYTVEYSTNLTDWHQLGAATPRYGFTDTNALIVPQRYYRLRVP